MVERINFTSILKQLAALFIAGLIITGWVTYSSQLFRTETSVKNQQAKIASEIAYEFSIAIEEYPAYEWLINYWHDNCDKLDIEYDAAFNNGTETRDKANTFAERHPDLQISHVTESDIKSMTEEDQKLYAEIAYSHLIDRIDQIKQAHVVDFIFCVLTEEPYDKQFFVLSGADAGAVRGTNYEEVYTLGVVSEVSESQQNAMAHAVEYFSHLADAGDYLDYYSYFGKIGDKDLLIGLTYDLSNINQTIRSDTINDTAAAIIDLTILSAICMLMVYLLVLRPLKKVQENIRLYRETKDSNKVISNLSEINSKNEIGVLTNDVIELTEEIDNYINEIESISEEKHRIESELDMARRIQLSMMPNIFPPFPDRKEFDIYASVDPAKEVGGDFYDFFLVDEDHLCLVIADVSGKGVPAALFMMAARIILKSCAMLGRSASEILTKTNEGICENNPQDMFVTTWVGILEISTGRLTAANAGHEYPAIMRSGGEFEIIKSKHGLFIGGMENAKYTEYELKLEPGDKIFLYTDGLPEATNCDGMMFGMDRMADALNEVKDGCPKDILKGIRKSVDGFVKEAEQFDDLTMMCVEYIGK